METKQNELLAAMRSAEAAAEAALVDVDSKHPAFAAIKRAYSILWVAIEKAEGSK